MNSLELFAGAGGLAIGMGKAGFHHIAVIEWNKDACQTFQENKARHTSAVDGWPVHNADARTFDYSSLGEEVVVVSGGPPCQPFSMGGKHAANEDERDMFPEAVRAVRELSPKAFIFENVKGLTRKSFAPYFNYILLQLQYPALIRGMKETWKSHRDRLTRHHAITNRPTYEVHWKILNAADFGVPQKRERVFFVGFRSDLGVEWKFPDSTHSEHALIIAQWVTGSYWAEHNLPRSRMKDIPDKLKNKVKLLGVKPPETDKLRWNTTRDAIRDLPDPEKRSKFKTSILNHTFIPGARTYKGHTGSSLDSPAKTLKAGNHGVPGGENMLIKENGEVRYFTVREAARLQTFPDDYEFLSSWSQTMRQLGNAVPVQLAQIVAASVSDKLNELAD